MSPRKTRIRTDRPPKLSNKGRAIMKALGKEELDAVQISERLEELGWSISARSLAPWIRYHMEGGHIEITRVYGKTSTRPLNRFKVIPYV